MTHKTAQLLLLIAIVAAMPAFAQLPTYTYTYSYQGAPVPIPRDELNIAVILPVDVPQALKVESVTVKVDIDYPAPGDLNVYFFSPIATRTKLTERNCGTSATMLNTTFDDAAASKYADYCPAEPGGSFRGNEPLGNYRDQNSFGRWWLAVENNGSNDRFGYARGVSVTIRGTLLADKPVFRSTSVFNLGSLQPTSLAPGGTIGVLGAAIGALPPTRVTSGDWPSSLGGTQVFINGTAVPLGYSSQYFVIAQVPFGIAPFTEATMVISNNGVRSDEVKLQVTPAAPAFVTVSEGGGGTVKAVNQDGKMNSQASPAPKGSVVQIYAVGLGKTSPELPAGYAPPAGTLSKVTGMVQAYVDGTPATVDFAGLAPGTVGFYQVNVRVPADAKSGARPIYLYVDGYPAQQNAIINVQ
jgi:uncharacterized protein (TIGR03437 family)